MTSYRTVLVYIKTKLMPLVIDPVCSVKDRVGRSSRLDISRIRGSILVTLTRILVQEAVLDLHSHFTAFVHLGQTNDGFYLSLQNEMTTDKTPFDYGLETGVGNLCESSSQCHFHLWTQIDRQVSTSSP